VKAHVDQMFPLAEAGAAQQLGETGRTRGKIVLNVP
jgi:NADPH:quinone reductase-like Zn-dependent oxidoreductase